MDAAILGPILGLLTLLLIWMRQDLVAVRDRVAGVSDQLAGVRERLARIENQLGLREDTSAGS